MKTAIVYASRYGFTEHAAKILAQQIGGGLYNLEQLRPVLSGETVLIIGTPIAVGEPHQAVKLFLNEISSRVKDINKIHFFVSGGSTAVLGQMEAWIPPLIRSKVGSIVWCGGEVDLKRVSLVGKLILLLARKFRNYRIENPGWTGSFFPLEGYPVSRKDSLEPT